MEVVNKVYPNEEQIKGFLEPGAEGPICMVLAVALASRVTWSA